MITHRIAKYNPENRNSDGSYSDQSEWTSISDIGNPDYGSPTYEQYEAVENKYVQAVLEILKEKSVKDLSVRGLELCYTKKDFDEFVKDGRLHNLPINFDTEISPLRNGSKISLGYLEKIIRLILRETIWMRLESEKVKVMFGYDYYMYVYCEPLLDETMREIKLNGVFVEREADQTDITAINEDKI
ncbi:MAG: hypothetical protein WA958_12730 [Tunicatimonas sp.]